MNERAPEMRPSEEFSQIPRIYEHLFPQCTWESLPPFDLRNILNLIVRAFLADDLLARDVDIASRHDQGLAHRITLNYPDKLLLGYLLLEVRPLIERPNQMSLNDLLEPGEYLGGAGEKTVFWPTTERGLIDFASFGRSLVVNDPKAYGQADVKVYGVLKEFYPKALILHKEGHRPNRKSKVSETYLLPQSALYPTNI